MNAWTVALLAANAIKDFTKTVWFTLIELTVFLYAMDVTPATSTRHKLFAMWACIIGVYAIYKIMCIVADMVDDGR